MFKRTFSRNNKILIKELVKTDFKLRYQGSVLGYLWSLLRPLLLFIILYVVFVKFLKIGNAIPHYPQYLLFGLVMWNFFIETTSQGLSSIVVRGDLIRKISIPKWIIVVSSSLAALINFSLNLLVIVFFMVIGKVVPSSSVYLLLFLFLELYIFSLGVSFFLSTVFVKYRDVNYIWEVVIQAGFYLTPIFYPLSTIHNVFFRKLILLNPLAQIIQDARYVTITHKSIIGYNIFNGKLYFMIPYILTLLIILIGASYFRRRSKYFPEEI